MQCLFGFDNENYQFSPNLNKNFSYLEAINIPDKLMDFVELILDSETETRLIEQKRVPGENNVGMVAWRLTLYTPEYPEGRNIIVIANDITYCIGAFGPREDKVSRIIN